MNLIEPNKLRLSDRFDIFIKVYLLKSLDGFISLNKGLCAYRLSLYAMNSFIEYDELYKPVKVGFNDFYLSFIELSKVIKENGFDMSSAPIPVDSNFLPLNGAHRIASSLYYGNNILVESINNEANHVWPYSYFHNLSFPHFIIESVFLNMINYHSNMYCACLYSSSLSNHDEFISLLNEHSDILADFTREYSDVGKRVLTSIYYSGENWVGNRKNKYKGTANKFKHCFTNGNKVRYVVFKFTDNNNDNDRVLELKERLRKIASIGKHSIHITDNGDETKDLLLSIMSPAADDWINNQRVSHFNQFESFLNKLEHALIERDINKNSFVIVGSSVLSAYGLRDCNDLDAISLTLNDQQFVELDIGNHNSYFEKYGFHLKEILGDEDNFFYYRGFKFLSLNLVKQFKERRGETKDRADLKLIDSILIKNNSEFHKKIMIFKFLVLNFKFKKALKKVLIKVGVIK
ncbi:hypothetical protein [Vibrio fluvialis]|uniref:hypothetical protein n=1 Tax=Vibrio fluvialis TaxID=676 RepID=UPI003D7ED639